MTKESQGNSHKLEFFVEGTVSDLRLKPSLMAHQGPLKVYNVMINHSKSVYFCPCEIEPYQTKRQVTSLLKLAYTCICLETKTWG